MMTQVEETVAVANLREVHQRLIFPMVMWHCPRTRPVYSTGVNPRPDHVDPLSSASTKGIRYQKTLHTAKINAVIRVHNISIFKLEVFLRNCQTAVP